MDNTICNDITKQGQNMDNAIFNDMTRQNMDNTIHKAGLLSLLLQLFPAEGAAGAPEKNNHIFKKKIIAGNFDV